MKKKKPLLIVLVIFVAIIAFLIYASNAGKQDRLEEQERAQQYINDDIYYAGTVAELSQMSDDEKDALLDKHIVVSGTYEKTSNSLYIKMGDNDFEVKAYMDDVPEIENNSIVTVDGVCTYVADSRIKMFLCTVVNIEEPIVIESEVIESTKTMESSEMAETLEMAESTETEESLAVQTVEMTEETSSDDSEKETPKESETALVEIETEQSTEKTRIEETSSKTEESKTDDTNVKMESSTTNEEMQESTDGYIHVGDSFVLGNLEYTIKEYNDNCTDYKIGQSPKKGYKYIRLGIYVENISSNSERLKSTVYSTQFTCYADNENCDNVSSYAFTAEDGLSTDTISSGRSATGAVYFEVPKDCTNVEIEYTIDFVSDEIFVIKCK